MCEGLRKEPLVVLGKENVAGISRDEVLHVARLARLELTDEEVGAVPGAAVGDHRGDLEGVGARPRDVPPTAHPLEIANTWAEDEPRAVPPLDEAFANAPDRDDDYFKVPPA